VLGLAVDSSISSISIDECATTLAVSSFLGPKAEIGLTAGVAGALHRPKEPWLAMVVKLATSQESGRTMCLEDAHLLGV